MCFTSVFRQESKKTANPTDQSIGGSNVVNKKTKKHSLAVCMFLSICISTVPQSKFASYAYMIQDEIYITSLPLEPLCNTLYTTTSLHTTWYPTYWCTMKCCVWIIRRSGDTPSFTILTMVCCWLHKQ